MIFTKLLLQNTLVIRPYNYEATSETLLPKVVRCIPVLSSRYTGKCATRVLKRSGSVWEILAKTFNDMLTLFFQSLLLIGGKTI